MIVYYFEGVYVGSSHMHNHPSTSIDMPGVAEPMIQISQASNHQMLRRASEVNSILADLSTNTVAAPPLSFTNSPQKEEGQHHMTGDQSSSLTQQSQVQQQPIPKSLSLEKESLPHSQIVTFPLPLKPDIEKRHSFQFGGDDSYLNFPSSMDSKSLVISLWVYLGETSSNTGTMLTLFSNKKTGCTPMSGYALYVNEWETSDRQLVCSVYHLVNPTLHVYF